MGQGRCSVVAVEVELSGNESTLRQRIVIERQHPSVCLPWRSRFVAYFGATISAAHTSGLSIARLWTAVIVNANVRGKSVRGRVRHVSSNSAAEKLAR